MVIVLAFHQWYATLLAVSMPYISGVRFFSLLNSEKFFSGSSVFPSLLRAFIIVNDNQNNRSLVPS